MLDSILGLLLDNIVEIIVVIVAVLLFLIIKRYIKLLYLLSYCRKLAKIYNGEVKKLHPLLLKTILNFKNADVKITFGDKELYVMFVRIKNKTVVRFVSENTIEKIRYKKAIVPSSQNKGLTPSYVVTYGQGSEVSEKRSQMRFDFDQQEESIKLILFTADPSEIRVFDTSKNNDKIIGDGEVAYGYYIGGRSFLKKWIERN